MKKYILLFCFVLSSLSSTSQVDIDFGLGYATKQAPVFELDIRKTFKNSLFSQIGYFSYLSNDVNFGAIFNLNTGMEFKFSDKIKSYPSVGYFYHIKSRKELNTSGVMISQKTTYKIDDIRSAFINLSLIENHGFFIIGFSVNTKSQNKSKGNKLNNF